MHDRNHELTAHEKAEVEALPRERMPGRLLEERTVKALRARGLLRRRPFRASWLTAAAAAAVALFATGFAAGQWSTSREVTNTLLVAQHQTAMEAAQMVQRTGTAYVTALAALAQLSDSSTAAEAAQGREVALAALYAAARELVELTPDDPVAIHIRRVLGGTQAGTRQDDQSGARNVVWF
jgi:hypothetical protein